MKIPKQLLHIDFTAIDIYNGCACWCLLGLILWFATANCRVYMLWHTHLINVHVFAFSNLWLQSSDTAHVRVYIITFLSWNAKHLKDWQFPTAA